MRLCQWVKLMACLSARPRPRPFRFVRMLKLIRAVKFMAKLNKLKQQEGLEASPLIRPAAHTPLSSG